MNDPAPPYETRTPPTGTPALPVALAGRLRRDRDGLIAAVAQDHRTGTVLMLAWMDDEALRRTLATGRATYWSRSRGTHWVKGETSGNTQRVLSIALDCDGDALLLSVEQTGPACHTGTTSCFNDRFVPLVRAAADDGDGVAR
jgi:phosphoribosyl-AMP cyclohydrolase